MADHPDCSANAIEKELKDKHDIGPRVIRRAIELAEERKEVAVQITGKGLANLHRLIDKEGGSTTSTDLARRSVEPYLDTSTPRLYDEVEREVPEELPIDRTLSRLEEPPPRTLFDLLTGGEWPICGTCGKPINECRGQEHRMLFHSEPANGRKPMTTHL